MKAEAETVSSGKEALRRISSERYDLIFLDHMMPEMSGVKVIREIRSDPEQYAVNRDTPYIVMTANAVVGAREKYVNEYGFDGYIAKPFRFAELEAFMSTYIPGDSDDGRAEKGGDGADTGAMGETSAGNILVEPPAGFAGGPPPGMGGPPPGAEGAVSDIDMEAGIDTCGGKDTYEMIAQTYLESSDEYKEKLASTHGAEDWENYRITVHALKSSSVTVGALNFADFSKSVEHAAGELIDGRDVMKNLGYLRGSFRPYAAAYAAVCESLKKVL